MKEILTLVRIDFDNMENHDARREKTIGVFVEGNGLTAHGNASKWVQVQQPIHLYLGYDGSFYPKFELRKTQSL